MACPQSRCEINVFHLTFIWCEVVQWNNIISFCGGQNEWKNIVTTSKRDRSVSDFIVLPLGFGIGCFALTLIRLDICKRWYLDLNGTVRHAASVKSICSIWNSFDARLWTGTTWSHFVEDRPFALLHFISISISFYFMIISSTLCIIETSLWVQECVSNSKFRVPCGLWLYVHLAALHWMPGSGMEQHYFIVWRTELLICQACASEEDVKAAWGCLFSNLDTSMSATSSGHAQFGSNVFFFCCCCPGTHGGHYFDNLRWAHSCGRRSVVPAESSCPAELQAALGFEANSGRGCL